MDNAAKLVAAAILGKDGRDIIVAGNTYHITPPTIKRIAAAAFHLADFDDDGNPLAGLQHAGEAAAALSCFIAGDGTLTQELAQGTAEEVAAGLATALELIGMQNFTALSLLAKNVKTLTAKQRQ